MNVIDSSAWLSYFSDDKNSDTFAVPIESSDKILVPSITLTEIFKHVLRQRGEEYAFEIVAHIQQHEVIPLDSNLAIDAAGYGLLYKLPLADSIIYATTAKFSAQLWTQDSDFERLPNVKYFSTK